MSFTFLLDTNIFIQLEEVGDQNEIRAAFIEFSSLCLKHGIRIQVHPLTRTEIAKDKIAMRRKQMLSRLEKYPVLDAPPLCERPEVEHLFGRIRKDNDVVDSQLLFAIVRRCTNYLISEDDGLHQRARHANIHDRVLTVRAAIDLIKRLLEPESVKLPNVEDEYLYNINLDDPIFISLRDGYGEFDEWYNRISAEQRKAWVVKIEGKIAGICIYKKETTEEFSGIGRPNLKLCTFKVAESARGSKLGELLLKQAFGYAAKNKLKSTWLTAFPKHQYLISFLKDFGFQVHTNYKTNKKTGEQEMVFFKEHFPPKDLPPMDPFKFYLKYSPFFKNDAEIKKYVIPIKPEYHDILFPEIADRFNQQLTMIGLDALENAPGNTIKKVYLSKASLKEMEIGSLIFFYRSAPTQGITTVGIVERTQRIKDLSEALDVVGKRSVYNLNQIRELLQKEIIIIEFRLIKHCDESIEFHELMDLGVLKGAPQGPQQLPHDRYLILNHLLEN